MDTHITTPPDIDERIGAPLGSPIRLPGGRGTLPHLEDHDLDPSSDMGGEPGAAETGASEPRERLVTATPRRARRVGLLSTVAVVVVLAGIGGAAWAERQGALNLPLPPKAVSLLRTGLPSTNRVASEVGVAAGRPQASAPVVVQPDPEQSARAARQQAEFASIKSGDPVAEIGVAATIRGPDVPATAAPVSPPQAAPTPVATAQISTPMPSPALANTGLPASPALSTAAPAVAAPASSPITNTTPAVIVSASAPAVAATVPATPPVPKPRDAVQTAIDVRAEPLSPKQQVEVVGLVRELGAQLKESRLTVAQMQATVADLKEQLDSRMTEFDGRLGLAEAGTVLAQSARAALPQPVMSAVTTPARPVAMGQRQDPVGTGQYRGPGASTPPASTAPVSRSVKDFRIQGASPGLAVLNVIGAAPGEAPVLYVALGEHVPGIGRIKSVYQRGTTWLVQTDAGLIQ